MAGGPGTDQDLYPLRLLPSELPDLCADRERALLADQLVVVELLELDLALLDEAITRVLHLDEGEVVATLVHRPAVRPPRSRTKVRQAVLHVHGFADYFFQTEFADWWAERGYDFYALDLRKYGRSLAEGHGLVWNPGEQVEGYTNFLWTVLMAVVHLLPVGDAHKEARDRLVDRPGARDEVLGRGAVDAERRHAAGEGAVRERERTHGDARGGEATCPLSTLRAVPGWRNA